MKLTWFGHSAFKIEFGSVRILLDPFLTGNPSFNGDPKEVSAGATHVLLTHGHSDHLGDALDICRANDAQLVGSAEVCGYLQGKGVQKANPGNHGGTVDCGGFSVSFVNALHSSSVEAGGSLVYLGNPLGLVVDSPGEPTLYAMGDTGIFGDMALINEIYQPKVGLVPIGDRFTMGGRMAAMACRRFFDFRAIIPCHYGTFGMLDQSADAFLAAMGGEAGKVIIPERGTPFEV